MVRDQSEGAYPLCSPSLVSGTMAWMGPLTMDLPESADGNWRRGQSGCPVEILRQFFPLVTVISPMVIGNTISKSPTGSSWEKRSYILTLVFTTQTRRGLSISTWCCILISSVQMSGAEIKTWISQTSLQGIKEKSRSPIECEGWRRHSWKRLINNVSVVCFSLIKQATYLYIWFGK